MRRARYTSFEFSLLPLPSAVNAEVVAGSSKDLLRPALTIKTLFTLVGSLPPASKSSCRSSTSLFQCEILRTFNPIVSILNILITLTLLRLAIN